MIDSLIANTKKDPNYKNIVKVIKIVKTLFNKDQEKEDDKKEPTGKAFNTAEYKKVFDFFVTDIPDLLLKLVGIDVRKFTQIDEVLGSKKKNVAKLSMKSVYGHINAKQSMLLKTYAANFNKLLKQSIEEKTFQNFFISGPSVVKVCLPFKIYSRKLANNMSKLVMQYSRIDASNQMLIFNALFHMMGYLQATDDHSYFDKCIKKMYMEFTKESKAGGGGHSVQITLRVAQNCFVELLGLNLPSAYQLGFLYIR
jgi:hypothetical protein